jgi:CubicO group peptidase (beta-lactamase class C family)
MVACKEGLLRLDQRVTDYLPQYRHPTTVRDLLIHESGLPAYVDVTDLQQGEEVVERILGLELAYAPHAQSVYSCVGFVVLQQVVEAAVGQTLDRWASDRLYNPLGMVNTVFNPDASLTSRCAPTERLSRWRIRLEDQRGSTRIQDEYIQGTVHDPLAFVKGGVSGNAGLFSTVEDVGRYLQALLKKGRRVIDADLLSEWSKRQGSCSSRALGWDTKSPEGSSAGTLFSATSYGHTGYTGTSVWIDPEKGIFAALLTNRVHPTSDNPLMTEFRPRFHDAVFTELSSESR